MPVDSVPITAGRTPDDLTSVITDILGHIQFKFLAFMLVVFIMLSSDVFINRALGQFSGAVDFKCPTSWGTCLQGMFLVMVMMIIDGLIRQKII